MFEIIYAILQLFTAIPYNIWPWVLLIIVPVIIFSAKPHHKASRRFIRILVAISIGYVLINLTLHTHHALQWKAKEQCEEQSIHRMDSPEMFAECGHYVNIADGASIIFYLALGWIPVGAYAGFWELWWRIKYRSDIRNLGKNYKGKWFSTMLIICSLPIWIFILIVMVPIIYMTIAHYISLF